MNRKIIGGIAITIIVLSMLIVGHVIFTKGSNESHLSPLTTPVIIGTPNNSQKPLNRQVAPINNDQTLAILSDDVVDANNQFASDLYSKYKSKEGNIFFSPFSISTALTMTYEGAKGKTAEEMRTVLHLPNDKQKIHSDFVSIYGEINKENKAYMLTTANALWVQKDYPFDSSYLSTVDTYYNGKVTNLDFKTDTEKSRFTINNWIENQTYHKIKNIIPLGILTSDTRLVLTNAIYFKANWSNQFDSQNTRDGKFYVNSNESIDSKMMFQKSYFNYSETSNLQILEMDYLGNNLSMLVILPKENKLDQIENIFNKENLVEWKKNMKETEVAVVIPKFKFEAKYFMAKDLAEMGMSTAFKFPDADFTGMSPTGELFIGQVIHQTFVEVAEYGTEAAAATVVEMVAGSAPAELPKIFNADHPFMFLIQQKRTGNILFMGRLIDPSK
jgi:serpin B